MGKHHVTITKSHVTQGHMSQSQHVIRKTHDGNNMRTTEGCCKATVVKCISSIQNQMGTLLSSSCQL